MPIQSTDTESPIVFDYSNQIWVIKAGVTVAVSYSNTVAVTMGHYGDLLDNAGSIIGDKAVLISSGQSALSVINHAGASIEGMREAIEVDSSADIQNAGEIRTGGQAVEFYDGYSTLENSGLIVGADAAVDVNGGGVDIDNTGTLEGSRNALRLALGTGDYVSLHNAGLLTAASSGRAIYSWSGYSGEVDVTNDGRIQGAIYLQNSNTICSLINTGSISGAINFGESADRYDGRAGSVTGVVSGGGGNDLLQGGTGDDTLVGGGGRDRMDGGKGDAADVFVFTDARDSKANAPDLIAKHWSATDTVDLSAIDANAQAAGQQHLVWAGAVTSGSALTPGSVGYYQLNGDTFVVFDNTGDGSADFKLDIHGKVTLNAGEFVL